MSLACLCDETGDMSVLLCSVQVNRTSGEVYVKALVDRERISNPLLFSVVATDLDSNVTQRNMNNASITLLGKLVYCSVLHSY